MDQHRPGPITAGQWRLIRPRADARRQRNVLCARRCERTGRGNAVIDKPGGMTRRGLVRAAAGLAAARTALGNTHAQATAEGRKGGARDRRVRADVEPFWGDHQAGITTPVQSHSYFAALDLETASRDDLVKMLRAWTATAADMAAGQSAAAIGNDLTTPGPDTGEALGLPPSRLTLTFGFGPGLFVK